MRVGVVVVKLQSELLRVPRMGDNLAVQVRYRLGSRNC
jgi:hypothetical protein